MEDIMSFKAAPWETLWLKKVKKDVISSVSYLQTKSQSRTVKMQHWVPIRAEKIKTWIIAAHRSTSGNPSTTLVVKSYYPHFTEKKTETQVFVATQNVMEQPDFEPRQPGSPVVLVHCMYNLLFSVWCSVPPFVIIIPPY